jgi:predicted HTH transcriptional regulator
MEDNSVNIYKLNTERSPLRSEIRNDLENNMQKFSDPVILGELMYKLLEERENTNRILKNILAKLENIPSGTAAAPGGEPLLPEVDEKIMEFVREKGRISAEDVRQHFNYKGKNAACARLNRLYELNLLGKKQVGKKVFFFPM